MQLRRAAVLFTIFLLSSAATAFNITQILSNHPELSTFNRYLTVTQLAPEINRRQTITICAVNDTAMADLLSKNLDLGTIRNVLALHVLLDYFDAKKLHLIANGTALAATVYQATGSAPGASGFVKITNLKGGIVGFSAGDNGDAAAATFVKSVEEKPYDYSVIQISNILPSPEAEAPAPPPIQVNLTAAMSANGCKAFAETLLNSAAAQTFDNNIQSGLTIFCPGDDAMKNFTAEFKNLTADGKQSLLEYHGMPVYESLSGLKSSNGIVNTLATDGANTFSLTVQNDGNDVTIITPIVTATIVSTVTDKSPVAIFQLDKVLMPKELFKSSQPPSPSPAPSPTPRTHAKAPKSSSPPAPPAPEDPAPADSPADAPGPDVPHKKSDGGVARYIGGARVSVVFLSIWFAFLQL